MLTDWVRAVCVFEGESRAPVGRGSGRRSASSRCGAPPRNTASRRSRPGTTARSSRLRRSPPTAAPLLATAGDDASVRIWDTASGRQIGQPLTGHTDRIHAIAAYNIGASARIATGAGDRTIRIWDPSSATLGAGSAQGQEYPAPAVAMFDEIAVTGGEDGTIRTWDLMTGRAAGPPVEGGVGAVRVLLADPRWPETGIAVGGEEGVVRFLDALTGSRPPHRCEVTQVPCARLRSTSMWTRTLQSPPVATMRPFGCGVQPTERRSRRRALITRGPCGALLHSIFHPPAGASLSSAPIAPS